MKLKGTIIRTLFRRESENFVIALLQEESGARCTILGSLGEVQEGDYLILEGDKGTHAKYGEQLRVRSFAKILPPTKEGLAQFLKKTVKGVGEKRAEQVAAVWERIKDKPTKLMEIEGLPLPRSVKETVVQKLLALQTNESVLISLLGLGLSPSLAQKVLEAYGEEAVAQLQKNPYQLSEKVKGVGFSKADALASRLGIAPDSPFRTRAAGKHILDKAEEEGHLFLPRQLFGQRLKEICGRAIAKEAVDQLFATSPFSLEQESIALLKNQRVERRLAELLRAKMAQKPNQKLLSRLPQPLMQQLFNLDPLQRKALATLFQTPISILTGGPGTGKTFALSAICTALQKRDISYAIAAPTGRAAQRIRELTGFPAKTLHRLLEYDPTVNLFQRNRDLPLEQEVVIIDECSMIDSFLCLALFEALPEECHLLLVGDGDQLPPVGPGSAFRDLLRSQKVPVVRLTKIHRQKRSLLLENAHRILGERWLDLKRQDNSFLFIETKGSTTAAQTIKRCYARGLRQGLSPAKIQVLAPIYKGSCGVHALNRSLRSLVLGRTPTEPFVPGDKVIFLRNHYPKGVFNGDLGIVQQRAREKIVVRFQEKEVELSPQEQTDLALAYAISIHKAQGSEFDVVLVPILMAHYFFLYRSLLYTALTRARKQAILVGEKRALFLAIHNQKESVRYTHLLEYLSRTHLDWR